MYSHQWKYFELASDSLSNVSKLHSIGKIESESIVPEDTYVIIGRIELLAYHSFCWKTTKPFPTLGKLEKVANSVFC